MRYLLLLLCAGLAIAEMVDRISIIVDGRIIKHSDVLRDIRLTYFLNHETLTFDLDAQKKAAARLIDQALIRKELQAGLYPSPDPSDLETLLQQLKQSLGSEAAYQRALASYGIIDQDLRRHLSWQLNVLRFINVRFAGGSQTPDSEQAVTGNEVNRQFFAWLDESEKNTPIVYNEEALK